MWFNKNRLTRLEHLDTNSRIREVFAQNNRLVSLTGLKNCKFLRVLIASNNQIQNLEKQLSFISRYGFLKKLDLSENPIADEPEYRLRLIYHAPQVEILDCAVVKGPERIKAAEVVPNLDKVIAKEVRRRRAKQSLSKCERDVFRETRDIRMQHSKAEEEAMTQMFASQAPSASKTVQHKLFATNAQAWSTPREFLLQEQSRPTAWEMPKMLEDLESLAGKKDLTRADVWALCKRLSEEGIEDMGRSLTKCDVFGSCFPAVAVDAGKRSGMPMTSSRKHPLEALNDPEATMPTKEVAKYLLSLDWHRHDESSLGRRIAKLYDDAKQADLAGNKKEQSLYQTSALRLGGVQDRLRDCQNAAKEEAMLGSQSARKPRADFFKQSLLRPHRLMDELTGRNGLHISAQDRSTSLGG